METNYSQESQSEVDRPAQPGLLLTTVHSIYHDQFRRWFGIMAPTSVLAGIVLVLADRKIRAISRAIPRGQSASHALDVLDMSAIRFGGFFLSWTFGAFALAAVATAVNELDAVDVAENWSRDAYQRAREHLGGIVAIAILTFCLFLLGLVGLGFVEFAVIKIVGAEHFFPHSYVFSIAGYVVIASIVGWLGAAIPLVVKGDTKITAALKKSLERSSGYEGALLLLVVESVAGSFIVWFAVVHGLPLLMPAGLTYSWWYVWVLNLIGLLASACIEAPLFIGFSVLADSERLRVRDGV